ncbi:MAG TPA: hypothetical protein VLV49_19355 [Terriglobales bacterium]|nr:hypothetical protein [Terriglobales bacterium]
MSTRINLLPPAVEPGPYELPPAPLPEAEAEPKAREWNAERFADEQILRLVRQVFVPGWPKPARHVVFSAVDAKTYVAEICMDVGKALACQVSGSVCVVEANAQKPELEQVFGRKSRRPEPEGLEFGVLHGLCQHVGGRLWLAPLAVLGGEGHDFSAAWLERRLMELHFEFDYTVLHAPAAAVSSEVALLGRLSDGVALVVEAQRTRRAAAQGAKEMLFAANVRLLGSVLSERRFPIPERLYRRL